jgi:hypothetical protein
MRWCRQLAAAAIAIAIGSGAGWTQDAAPGRPALPAAAPGTLTGKERLKGKAADEQRVDDCNVAPEQRSKPRPVACPWDKPTED